MSSVLPKDYHDVWYDYAFGLRGTLSPQVEMDTVMEFRADRRELDLQDTVRNTIFTLISSASVVE